MALISGNTVVFKPSALTALVGEEIKKIFESSGLPEGVLNVIQGSGSSVGDTLMGSGLNHVVFTGSVPVGKQLMAQAAQTLTSITLELGGKDPFIVLKDANIDRAAAAAVWGAFVNAGQVCTSVERVYVDKKVADKFTNKVLERTRKLRVGNGLRPDVDMGPMISEDRITLVEAHLADAVAKGAKILCGGKRMANLPGYFFEPTVLSETNHEMDCIREETFGPTLPIMVFSDEEEAIELANDNRYGLHASVWSRDTKRARRLGEKIEAGTVIINNCLFTYGFSECPWGGVKDSGIGRTHSVHGLREFANLKNITVNEALLKEDPWWYPYSQVKYDLTKTAFKAMFCGGMACRGKAVTEAVQAFGKRRKKKS
jgi:succinate-semialdehyde dehydrogenase/glutarate-semialdehyde dehydrogenase